MHQRASLLAQRSFRAGAGYDLVPFDRLGPEEQVLLAELCENARFYGILRPRPGTGRTIRAVDRDTALLWFGAQSPGKLPFFAWEGGADTRGADRRVAQLVLDGVLEIEQEGEYVSGAAALSILPARDTDGPTGYLGDLSLEALRYGQRLKLDDGDALAARLYGYGGIPITPAWDRRLPDSTSVLTFLGVRPGTALQGRLASQFSRVPEQSAAGWIAWTRPGRRGLGPQEPSYKLYVSPAPDDLPRVFAEVVDVLAQHEHLQFKVGASALGVLRADKLVIYFRDDESLGLVATALTARLGFARPQGVPFSSEVALGGLLSWGMDPPGSARALSWQGTDSWRLWIVRRLAAAMIAAQSDAAPDVEPSSYALERLRLDGVDVDGWVPSHGSWWTG